MSTKNGKKSRNRRHEEPNFKPPPTHSIDELPKQNIKKTFVPTEPDPEIINPIAADIASNSPNGNSSRDGSTKSRSRSNTPQSGKKLSLNNGSDNGEKMVENGSEIDFQVDSNEQHLLSSTDSTDNLMEPLVLDSNEPEPELQHLGDSDSPDQQQQEQDDPSKNSPNPTRCTTRRSQTRYIPTPETPHSFVSSGDVVGLVMESGGGGDATIEQIQPVEQEAVLKKTQTDTPTSSDQSYATPTVTVTPSTPPTLASITSQSTHSQQLFDTSSTHSDANLSDAATDNCSTHAVAGSDTTRMNMRQFIMPNDSVQNDTEEDIYAEIAEPDETRVDSGYSFSASGGGGGDDRPRSREGYIARALTGRKSIRPGTDYRKYLLERGMGGLEGSYSPTLGSFRSASTSSGTKRKTFSTEFSTSTPTTLKRRKLDTPQTNVSWFSYLSQPLYSLKNCLTRSYTTTELPQTNATPKLTAYKTKTCLEQDIVDHIIDEVGDDGNDVSLGVEAMEGDKGKGREIPVTMVGDGEGSRKSCVIM